MSAWIEIALSNAVAASLLALIAFAAGRATRNAPASHFLWALVLLKLVTPPLVVFHLPVFGAEAGGISQPRGSIVLSRDAAYDPSADALDSTGLSCFSVDEPAAAPMDGLMKGPASPVLPVSRASIAGTGPGLVGGPASRPLDLAGAVGVVWLLGSVLWWSLAASRLLLFRRLLKSATPAPESLVDEVRLVAERLGLRRLPGVVLVGARISPLVWAIGMRPKLVLPRELLAALTADQRRTLLAHELAHLRRRDHWWRRLELLALGLYWWFPVAWWARLEMRQVEEECCDGWVQWAFPLDLRRYARTLLQTVDFLSQSPAALPEGVSGMAADSLLHRRFQMILQGRLSRRPSGACRAILVSFAALVLPCAAGLIAQDQPVNEPAAAETAEAAEAAAQAAADRDAADSDATAPSEVQNQLRSLELQLERIEKEIARLQNGEARKDGDMKRQYQAGRRALRLNDSTIEMLDNERRVWSTATDGKGATVQFDPTGKRLTLSGPGRTTVIDSTTGKIISEDFTGETTVAQPRFKKASRSAPAQDPQTGVGAADPDARLRNFHWENTRGNMFPGETWPAGGANAAAGPGGARTDVVRLAEGLIAAQGALKLAAVRKGTAGDADAARIEVETAESRVDLLRRMARSALKGTRGEIDRLLEVEKMARVRFHGGQATADDLAAVGARLSQAEMAASLLEEILQEGGGSKN